MYTIKFVGTDTEIFLRDAESFKPVPVVGLIGGTKASPRPIDDMGAALQEDNVMLEFNTTPARTSDEWVSNINKVIMHITEELRAKKLLMDIAPSVLFQPSQLESDQAKVMGCDPDFNAWTRDRNPLINPGALGNLRTAGGHVHVSFSVDGDHPTKVQKLNLIRMLDVTLGLPSIILDDDSRRREFYGRAGAHRIKSDDRVEYRTLSNFWIRNDKLKAWVFNGVSEAFKRLNYTYKSEEEPVLEAYKERIITAIQKSDRNLAQDLISLLTVPMPA